MNETAQAMVGWTVFNRMKKHKPTRVSEVWASRQFAHGHSETGISYRLAEGIRRGTAIGGGLESVPGVHKSGKPVQNHRPRWTTRLSAIRAPGVPEEDFKFYRVP